jgi:hypothetical protein
MITYVQSSLTLVMVKLDGRHVGNILPFPSGGFQYMPIGSRNVGGDRYETIAEVKRSIEGEEE